MYTPINNDIRLSCSNLPLLQYLTTVASQTYVHGLCLVQDLTQSMQCKEPPYGLVIFARSNELGLSWLFEVGKASAVHLLQVKGLLCSQFWLSVMASRALIAFFTLASSGGTWYVQQQLAETMSGALASLCHS